MYQATYKGVTRTNRDKRAAVIEAINDAGDVIHIRIIPVADGRGAYTMGAVLEVQPSDRTEANFIKAQYMDIMAENRLATAFTVCQEFSAADNKLRPGFEDRLYDNAITNLCFEKYEEMNNGGQRVKKARLQIVEVADAEFVADKIEVNNEPMVKLSDVKELAAKLVQEELAKAVSSKSASKRVKAQVEDESVPPVAA